MPSAPRPAPTIIPWRAHTITAVARATDGRRLPHLVASDVLRALGLDGLPEEIEAVRTNPGTLGLAPGARITLLSIPAAHALLDLIGTPDAEDLRQTVVAGLSPAPALALPAAEVALVVTAVQDARSALQAAEARLVAAETSLSRLLTPRPSTGVLAASSRDLAPSTPRAPVEITTINGATIRAVILEGARHVVVDDILRFGGWAKGSGGGRLQRFGPGGTMTLVTSATDLVWPGPQVGVVTPEGLAHAAGRRPALLSLLTWVRRPDLTPASARQPRSPRSGTPATHPAALRGAPRPSCHPARQL